MKFNFVRIRDRQTQCGASQNHVWRRVIPELGVGRQPVVLILQRWLGQNACDEIKARLFILYHSRRHIDDVGVRQRLLARQQPPTHSKGYEEKQ